MKNRSRRKHLISGKTGLWLTVEEISQQYNFHPHTDRKSYIEMIEVIYQYDMIWLGW